MVASGLNIDGQVHVFYGEPLHTHLVRDFTAGAPASDFDHLTTFGREFIYSVQRSASEYDLWASDSVTGTTEFIAQFSERVGFLPDSLADPFGAVFFTVGGTELWKTDGTSAGTGPNTVNRDAWWC